MRILLDQCTPVPLRHALKNHQVSTAYELGWATLRNGELLSSAEMSGFQVLVTADSNLRYQQNLTKRKIAIVVLPTTRWRSIERAVTQICKVIDEALPGSYVEIEFDGFSAM